MKRNNHLIPKFYLRYFSDVNEIVSIATLDNRRFSSGISRASVERDFYLVNDSEAVGEELFEDLLNEIETSASKVMNEFNTGNLRKFSPEDRRVVSDFIAAQILRSRSMRNQFSELIDTFTGLGFNEACDLETGQVFMTRQSMTESHLLIAPKVPEESGERDNFIKERHLSSFKSNLDLMSELISRRKWILMQNITGKLVTSDHPVVIHESDPQFPTGFMNAEYLYFPLNRSLGLLMEYSINGFSDFEILVCDSAMRKTLNTLISYNARLEIYFHPDDEKELPRKLPRKRDSELNLKKILEDFKF
jgi:hypothetical protein